MRDFAIWPCVPAASRDHFLRELLKDTAVYAFLAVFLVSGMHRYAACAGALQGMNKWIAFAVFGGFACLLGVLALALDMFVASNIEIFGARGYPERWQRDLIVAHIYLRDWLLLVPLSIFVFARLLLRVSRPPRKSKGGGKRAGGDMSSANAQS